MKRLISSYGLFCPLAGHTHTYTHTHTHTHTHTLSPLIIAGPASIRSYDWSDGGGGEAGGSKREDSVGMARREGEGEEGERGERDGAPEEGGGIAEKIQETGIIMYMYMYVPNYNSNC